MYPLNPHTLKFNSYESIFDLTNQFIISVDDFMNLFTHESVNAFILQINWFGDHVNLFINWFGDHMNLFRNSNAILT